LNVNIVDGEGPLFFSVIIPTYNRAALLPRAMSSVLGQNYQKFDLWIVDDGSSDDTPEIVREFQSRESGRIHYVRTDNRGVSAARNLGAQLSGGQWLAFLDSDDEWLPAKLEKQRQFIQENPEIKIVHGEELWIRRGKRVNAKKIHQKSGGRIFQRCLKLCLLSPSAVILRRDLYQELGGFDENFPVCEDYDLWLKITARHQVGFILDPIIVKYGGHVDQLSAKFKAMDYWRVKAMHALFKEGPPITDEEKKALVEEIQTKSEILLKGYGKHNHPGKQREIREILEYFGEE
jgi:glycosyltransferase involved in cell wall biosynthesis